MSIKNRLKSLIECAVFGHVPFNTGDNTSLRVFQSKSVGNKYHDFMVCERCNTVYTQSGELTAAELAEEKRIEEYNTAIQSRMEKVKDEIIKKMTEAKVNQDKNSLN
jgi:hypothetical protein